jgi:hypothetical protein
VAGQHLDLVLAGARSFEDIARHLGRRAVQSDTGRLTIGIPTDGSAAGGDDRG